MPDIDLKIYDETSRECWDQFVRTRSRNGGIFHEQKFLGYHQPGKFTDQSLLFYEDGEIVGVLPAASTSAELVSSHSGSSTGGLVYAKDANLQRVINMLELAITHYREKGFQSFEMKIAEPIFHDFPDGELNYLLWHRGFRLKTMELSSCVYLDSSSSWEKLGRKKNLTDIRKLERDGFRVQETDNCREAYAVIEKNLSERYNKRPTHNLAELELLKELYPDRIHFWKADKDGQTAAVIVLFDVTGSSVHDFYIAQNGEFSQFNILPLLFYRVFEHYRERGFSWFNFGISTREDLIKWGILEFKERMGGRGVNRQLWVLDDLQQYKPYTREG